MLADEANIPVMPIGKLHGETAIWFWSYVCNVSNLAKREGNCYIG